MIKIYGVPRSRALRPLWMCEELGLQYENVKTNFATGDTRALRRSLMCLPTECRQPTGQPGGRCWL